LAGSAFEVHERGEIMNALAKVLPDSSSYASGGIRVSKNIALAIPKEIGVRSHGNVDARFVRWSAESRVEDQFLIFEQRSWAAENLSQVIGSQQAASAEEFEAACAAFDRLALRSEEDPSGWAKELGEKFATYMD
jgi:hypothetical protein